MRALTLWLALTVCFHAVAGEAPAAPATGDSKAIPVPPPDFPDTDAAARRVAHAIRDCSERPACATLAQFGGAYAEESRWLKAWCHARRVDGGRPSGPERIVCAALLDGSPSPADVTVFSLAGLARSVRPPSCDGFGLTLPLFGIRHRDTGTFVNGPVKAGLGGGYYWGLLCRSAVSLGPEAFVWTEGLVPSGLFHVGVAGGAQIAAFRYFQFGLALGYDLYRSGPGIPSNGLLAGRYLGKESFTWLVTLSFTSQSSADPAAGAE